MNDGTNLIYIILDKGYDGQINTRAICTDKQQYDDYAKTHDIRGTRTIVINPDNPKFKNSEKFMEKVYESDYTIIDYYGKIPVTAYEEQMIIEAESSFHCHMISRIHDIRRTLAKEFIKFSKSEIHDIDQMLNIIHAKSTACTDEEDICDEDPFERINYEELIIQGKLLV